MSLTEREGRAEALKPFSTLREAVEKGGVEQFQDLSLSEALVLGLWNLGVRSFIGIFGHGSTDIAEVLRIYETAGLVKMINVRHETEAAHGATALRWIYDEQAAVITSIGPGALHAFAGSLAAASNNLGVWHIYGDETSEDEGFNMQQIPRDEQHGFLKTFANMGGAYTLQDPRSIFTALRRGAVHTGRRAGAGPYFLLAPMNKQPELIRKCNLLEFPAPYSEPPSLCADTGLLREAALMVKRAKRTVIKYGRGAIGCGGRIVKLSELADGAIVGGPSASGVVPHSHPRFMGVGGSKGSISGNRVMNEADLVLIIGARSVCQWDSSGTAFKKAEALININMNPHHGTHYNRSLHLTGDAGAVLDRLIEELEDLGIQKSSQSGEISPWRGDFQEWKREWMELKKKRSLLEPIFDSTWNQKVLSQPAAISLAIQAADRHGAVKVFDAGDVQANGFQLVEDEDEWQTVNETGASYMGFAASSLIASALTWKKERPICAFSGEGSFMMNPQILIDGVEHGVEGTVIIFDNRKMAAISGLQSAQYGEVYRTFDGVEVDYLRMASAIKGIHPLWGGTSREEFQAALEKAFSSSGLWVIHVPVYSGSAEEGGMGVYGDWNVGNWCERVQNEHHQLGL